MANEDTDGWRWKSNPPEPTKIRTGESFMNLTSKREAISNRCMILGLGQLGKDLQETFMRCGWDVSAFTKFGLDITNYEQLLYYVKQIRPSLIINCAAIHHLPNCEAFPEQSFAVNVSGASRVAFIATGVGAKLVYISTDQVFDGAKTTPYAETDKVNPLNRYAKDKAAGERMARFTFHHYVVRMGCLFGNEGVKQKGGNFVTKLLQSTGVVRMTTVGRISPSWTRHVSEAIKELIRKEAKPGIYHVVNSGEASWTELAKYIVDRAGRTDIEIIPDSTPQNPPRPAYSVLGCEKLAKLEIVLPPWERAVDGYLDEIRHINPVLLERPLQRDK